MELQFMATVLLLSLSQLSFSMTTPKPNTCPSVSALKAIGINSIVKEDYWYGGVKSANYGTKENWSFAIGAFQAKNQEDAKSQMIDSLNSLTFESGPVSFVVNGRDSWICTYKDLSGHDASTITPILDFASYLHTSFKHL